MEQELVSWEEGWSDQGSIHTYEENSCDYLENTDPFVFDYIDENIPLYPLQRRFLESIRSTDGFPQEESEEETTEILGQFPLEILSNIVRQIDCAETLYAIASNFKRFRKAINSPGIQGHCKALSFAQCHSLVLPPLRNDSIVEEPVYEDFVAWYEGSFYTKNSDEQQKTLYDIENMNFSVFDSTRPLLLGKDIECRYVECIGCSIHHIEEYLTFFATHGAYDATLSIVRRVSYTSKKSPRLIDIIISSPLFPRRSDGGTPPDIHFIQRSDGGKELVFRLLTWVNRYISEKGAQEMEAIIERLRQLNMVFTVDDLLTLPTSNSAYNNYYSSSSSY